MEGSRSSKTALKWAFEKVRIRRFTLEASVAFYTPASSMGVAEAMVAVMAALSEEQVSGRGAELLVQTVLDELFEGSAASDVSGVGVERKPIAPNPSQVLIAASKNARFLVVGAKRCADIASISLGSVGKHCVHHALCRSLSCPKPHRIRRCPQDRWSRVDGWVGTRCARVGARVAEEVGAVPSGDYVGDYGFER